MLALILIPWQVYCAAYGLHSSDYDLKNVASLGYLRDHADRSHPIVRELWYQLQNWHHWGFLVAAIGAGVVTGIAGRRWRSTAFATRLARACVGRADPRLLGFRRYPPRTT